MSQWGLVSLIVTSQTVITQSVLQPLIWVLHNVMTTTPPSGLVSRLKLYPGLESKHPSEDTSQASFIPGNYSQWPLSKVLFCPDFVTCIRFYCTGLSTVVFPNNIAIYWYKVRSLHVDDIVTKVRRVCKMQLPATCLINYILTFNSADCSSPDILPIRDLAQISQNLLDTRADREQLLFVGGACNIPAQPPLTITNPRVWH